jgi:CBS-domain-containing membrane protein
MLLPMGLTADTVRVLGIVEVLSILLFIIPRTGVFGAMLLSAYIGGAIATHLEHAMSVVMPVVIECVIFITAAIRFPEIASRLFGSTR